MGFTVYTQQQMLSSVELTDFMLNTIIENLSYIYGEDMGAEENRKEWIQYNLKTVDPSWRAVIGKKRGENAGFVLYTIKERTLLINDIEICKANRFDPYLMGGLFSTLFQTEDGNFDRISGYVNKANTVSQKNFLKYATSVSEKARGYTFLIDKEKTLEIKEKFQKST